ncbi:MAG: MCP four helix bundle domain-containing protein, partial [Azoarcus sp.]|nr:MCP four helix bundle domain-containing protein [Azoarcus sp.]
MNNLKIGVRLAIAFALVIALLIIMALFSMQRIGSLASEVNVLVTDRYVKTVWANNVLDELNMVARASRNALLVSNRSEAERELGRIPQSSAKITENLGLLRAGITTDRGKDLLRQVDDARGGYVTNLQRLQELIRADSRDAAVALLMGDMRTTQTAYIGTISNIITYQDELMKADGTVAVEMGEQSRQLMIVLAVVAVLLAALLAFLIARSITRPVAQVADAANKMAKGDFSFTLSSDAKDEVGEVVRAVASVQASVKTMVEDAAMLTKAAVEGKLATRADAAKHQGDYRRIVEGVNATLDAVIGPLNVAADYVDRISKGAIPPRITDTYNGDFNTIKTNLNTCIDAVGALVADAVMLSQAAIEGKLATRADASKHQGDYRKIVDGVNGTLDAVIDPVNEVKRVMIALSQGDLTQKIHTQYAGDFKVLQDAVNESLDKLGEIIGQVRGAADALSNASGQVSSTAQSLSQASSEQAASVEESSASVEQMTASINQNSENAKVTDGMATKSSTDAVEGGEAVRNTVEAMKNIAGKIGIIDDIAYQTNLLALNAAIEAARA